MLRVVLRIDRGGAVWLAAEWACGVPKSSADQAIRLAQTYYLRPARYCYWYVYRNSLSILQSGAVYSSIMLKSEWPIRYGIAPGNEGCLFTDSVFATS